MKKTLFTLLLFVFMTTMLSAQTGMASGVPVKIKADPAKGFFWDYLLLLPDSLQQFDKAVPLFVLPNNTGVINDTIAFHEKTAREDLLRMKQLAKRLHTPLLMPVFPRPRTNWKIYTHALDRDVMTTGIKEISRLDLQLVAMINNAKEVLKNEKIKVQDKIFIMGFSASGMFTNRFTLLHPDLVKAAAVGSPGGMPMLPVTEYEGKSLYYPIGIDDFAKISGSDFDMAALRNVNIYFFLGDQDKNDAVVYRDGFEKEDEDLIMKHFGKTLQERWEKCRAVYEKNNLPKTKFVLYPGIDHKITSQMYLDLISFFSSKISE